LDLFGKGFVLLNLSGKDADTSPFTSAARAIGLPLQTVTLSESRIQEAYERAFVLVRPDGHIAWRGDSLPEKPRDILDRIRGAR
jgi:hypothetical protein